MALITRLTQDFTGPDVAKLPVIRPGFGVGGTLHRWRAADLTGADGTAITSITSTLSGLALTGNATLKIESGKKFLRFNGTSDMLYSGTRAGSELRTIVMIARMHNAGTAVASYGAGNLTISSGGTVVGAFTGATNWTNTGQDRLQWRLLTVRVGGTTGQYHGYSNNGTLSGDMAGATTDNSFLRLGAAASSGAFGTVDIMDVATWPTVLTDADIAKIYAGAKQIETTIA